jgi:hypothetical protein
MMRKVFFRSSWLAVLGFVLTGLPAGCNTPNEGEAESGIAEGKGIADPKYAAGTPEQYKQFHIDSMKTGAQGKVKATVPKQATTPKEAAEPKKAAEPTPEEKP